jgi:hypothetical protein
MQVIGHAVLVSREYPHFVSSSKKETGSSKEIVPIGTVITNENDAKTSTQTEKTSDSKSCVSSGHMNTSERIVDPQNPCLDR